MKEYLDLILSVFRFHKKKIAFLFGMVALWFVILFPYDDLSDYITLKVTQATQSAVYLQFDGLSFGFLPQLGIKMDNVVIESTKAPTLSMQTLGFAPSLSTLFGSPGGKLKAYGLFKGDATVNFGSSQELDIEGPEFALGMNLQNVALKEISKFLKKHYNFSISMAGNTNLDSSLNIDPSFKVQPKGTINFTIKKLDIPSTNLPLNYQGVTMSLPLPALKISDVEIEGSLNDGKLFIKQGKIGDGSKNDDLFGKITGDLFFNISPGGRLNMRKTGYDLRINLNISENLKRQLGTILGIIDLYKGIGDKHKFDSLKGVRYSMRLTAPKMSDAPRVQAY